MDLWIEKADPDGTIGCLAGPTFPMAYTEREGGNWLAIGAEPRIKEPVAAVLFEDYSIYDFVLADRGVYPWRKRESRPTVRAKAVYAK